jgi:hypothetical protein
MAKEKIEDISTEKLIKRRKFFDFLFRVYLGIAVVVVFLIFFDLIKGREMDNTTLIAGLVILLNFWYPLLMVRKIKAELTRRAGLE